MRFQWKRSETKNWVNTFLWAHFQIFFYCCCFIHVVTAALSNNLALHTFVSFALTAQFFWSFENFRVLQNFYLFFFIVPSSCSCCGCSDIEIWKHHHNISLCWLKLYLSTWVWVNKAKNEHKTVNVENKAFNIQHEAFPQMFCNMWFTHKNIVHSKKKSELYAGTCKHKLSTQSSLVMKQSAWK